MKVRFIRDWPGRRQYRVGVEATFNDGVANVLIHKRRIAVEVPEPKETHADQIPEPAPEGGNHGGSGRQRGRKAALAAAGRDGRAGDCRDSSAD